MKCINPIKRKEEVKKRVLEDCKRMVYKTRPSTRYYGGIYTYDIAGCNFDCAYCWTSTDTKLGYGPVIDKLKHKNTKLFFSPHELWEKYDKSTDSPKIRLSGGEPFITPEFVLSFLDIGSYYYKKKSIKGQIWLETNGFELSQDPKICEHLKSFKDYLRIYLSLKQTPKKYSETTGIENKYHDTGFKALELLLKNEIITIPAGPLANLFDPKDIPYFVERIQKIHKNAPLIVELGDIVFMPAGRISKRLNERGFTKDKRFSPKELRKAYSEHLKKIGLDYVRIDTDCRTNEDVMEYVKSVIKC